MHALGRSAAIIVTVIMVLFTALQYISQSQVESTDTIASTLTSEFVDTARHQGYLTDEMYQEFLDNLSRTGDQYDVKLEVSHPVSASEEAFADSLLKKTANNSKGKLLLLASGAHVHTDACYSGIKHVHTGSSTTVGGCYGQLVSTSTCNETAESYKSMGKQIPGTCSFCSRPVTAWVNINYYRCPKGHETTLTYLYDATCQFCGNRDYYNKLAYGRQTCGYNTSTYSLNCGKTEGVYYDASGNVCQPICDKVVTSIAALSPIQSVYTGDSLNTYATATYLDGHYSIVSCSVSGYNANSVGTQTVILTYNGLVDNAMTTGTKTCTISVTVGARHSHTDACYDGTKHVHSGSTTVGGGCYGIAIDTPCNGHLKPDYVYNNSDFAGLSIRYCPYCNQWLQAGGTAYYCDTCGKKYDQHRVWCANGCYSVYTSYPGITIGSPCSGKTTYQINCGKTEGKYYDSDGKECLPICDRVVTSITAVNPSQAVTKGGSIDTTAIATYLDGHTGTVNCTASGFNANSIGSQTVTLIYSGLVDNAKTTGTKSCSITVNVVNTNGSHVHTDACYAGHRHVESGCPKINYYTGPPINYTIYNSYPYPDWNSNGTWRATYITGYCSSCMIQSFTFCYNEFNHITSYVGPTSSTIEFSQNYYDIYNNINTYRYKIYEYLFSDKQVDSSWKLVYTSSGYYYEKKNPQWDAYLSAYQTALVYCYNRNYSEAFPLLKQLGFNESFRCTNCLSSGYISKTPTSGWSCGQTQDETPICNQVVMGITAIAPTQSVNIGGDINSSVNAIMLDGSNKVLNCTVSGFDKYKIGTQTVTLTYSGLIKTAKTTGTMTCRTLVTVADKVLQSISVAPSEVSVKRYTDADELPIKVTALYESGESKDITTGYIITGYSKETLGKQDVVISYAEGGKTKTANVSVTVTHLTTTCPVCGFTYELDDNDFDNGCPYCTDLVIGISATPDEVTLNIGELLNITVTADYQNGGSDIISGWESNFNPEQLGFQLVKITYREFDTYVKVIINNTKTCPICGFVYELNDDGTDPGCHKCSAEVVSISAEPKDIKIKLNSKLDLTVTATYRDGHTSDVTGWYTDFTANTVGTYEAVIFYKKTSDKVNVTVYDDLIKCPYCGTEYEYAENPKGCPKCSKIITGIEASLRDGGTKVVYQSQPNIQIALLYKDMHKENVYTGWTISGYRADMLGEQTITVYYNEFQTDLVIEVIKNPFHVTCPICGTEYYLNEDGTDPGCPSCNADANKEDAVMYFDVTYTNEILDALYTDGIYHFNKGDYFTISISLRGNTFNDKLQRVLPRTSNDARKEGYSFGGEVSI